MVPLGAAAPSAESSTRLRPRDALRGPRAGPARASRAPARDSTSQSRQPRTARANVRESTVTEAGPEHTGTRKNAKRERRPGS